MEERKKIKISGPLAVSHVLHVDNKLNWEFNEQTDAEHTFQKIEDMGKGGFGTVCRLLHLDSGMHFAGKVISPDAMSRASKECLAKEMALLRQIKSDYTIHYYGSVNYQNSVMLMMELCDRGSVRDVMDYFKMKLNESQIKIIIRDVLLGLLDLHTRYRVIHRDVKAANILLGSDGRIRLTDFGVSRQFENKSVNTSSSVGTPYWMAPEVLNGEKYSFPVDVWSVGATAVELLEGIAPYGEYSVMKAIVSIAKHGFAGFRNPWNVSAEMASFVSRCMEMEPAKRATIPELLQHPFLSGTENLDRMEILKPMLEGEIDFAKLLCEEEEEECVYEEEEEVYDDDDSDFLKLAETKPEPEPEPESNLEEKIVGTETREKIPKSSVFVAGLLVSLFILYKTLGTARFTSLVILICIFIHYKD